MPGGRPTKYRTEHAIQAKKLALLGETDMQIADFFGISIRTFDGWKRKYPKLLRSLKVGKAEPDARVKRSLYQRAIGFEHDAVKVGFAKDGTPQYAPYREYIVPDTTACIFWLKNRLPEEFREKSEVEVTGTLAEAITKARNRLPR